MSDPEKQATTPNLSGIKAMSIGFMIEEDQAVIRRGPMVSKALKELTGKLRSST